MLADAPGHLSQAEALMPYRFIRRPKYTLMEYDYDSADDLRKSIKACFDAVKERVANGEKGWGGWPPERKKDHVEGRSGDSKPQDPRGG